MILRSPHRRLLAFIDNFSHFVGLNIISGLTTVHGPAAGASCVEEILWVKGQRRFTEKGLNRAAVVQERVAKCARPAEARCESAHSPRASANVTIQHPGTKGLCNCAWRRTCRSPIRWNVKIGPSRIASPFVRSAGDLRRLLNRL